MKIICTVKDTATQDFGPLLEFKSENEALRTFKNETNNPASRIKQNPEDFEMYKVAMYDEQKAEVVGMEPSLIARAKDMVEVQK